MMFKQRIADMWDYFTDIILPLLLLSVMLWSMGIGVCSTTKRPDDIDRLICGTLYGITFEEQIKSRD